MAEYIERGAFIKSICNSCDGYCDKVDCDCLDCKRDCRCEMVIDIADATAADVVEVDKVAEMLRLSFGDDCACNFNGNDEWMWEKCKYAESDCPYPKDELGCWKEFVKHFLAKMDGKGEGE